MNPHRQFVFARWCANLLVNHASLAEALADAVAEAVVEAVAEAVAEAFAEAVVRAKKRIQRVKHSVILHYE